MSSDVLYLLMFQFHTNTWSQVFVRAAADTSFQQPGCMRGALMLLLAGLWFSNSFILRSAVGLSQLWSAQNTLGKTLPV